MPRDRRPVAALALLLATFASAARADEPGDPGSPAPRIVGDDAPPLAVGRWLRGEPVEHLDHGRVYVIDFWAAQIGACKVTVPHLSALAAKYPAATFVGVSLDVTNPDAAAEKLKQFGDQATYRFAVDAAARTGPGEEGVGPGTMLMDWLQGGRLFTGQPITFIVDADGTLQWVGSPMRVDAPLAKILDGTFDRDAARKIAIAAAAKLDRIEQANREYIESMNGRAGRPTSAAEAYAAREKIFGKYPETRAIALGSKFNRLILAKQYDDAYATADEWAAAADDDAQALNELAWTIVDNEGIERRDLPRAQRYAERAVAISDGLNGAILDTLAKAMFLQGNLDKAIELQSRAVEFANPGEEEQLRGTLAQYQSQRKK